MCLHVLTVRNAEQEILMRQRTVEGNDVKKRMHVMKEGKRVQRGAVAHTCYPAPMMLQMRKLPRV